MVKAKKAKTRKKKKVIKKDINRGRIYIQSTFNNSIISITDDKGNLLSWASAGSCGFKGTRKSTPYAAQIALQTAVEKSKVYNLKSIEVFISGVGSGRESAVRALQNSGLIVHSIKDTTPVPHNGCRAKKARRV